MNRKRFDKNGSFIIVKDKENNDLLPTITSTTTNTLTTAMSDSVNNITIFQLMDTIFPKQESNFYKNNFEEKIILNNLRKSIENLEQLKLEWEKLVIEGDILEKSCINIGNSGDSKLYGLFPAIFECKDIFRIKYRYFPYFLYVPTFCSLH